jgi:hypothetical protein
MYQACQTPKRKSNAFGWMNFFLSPAQKCSFI